MAAEAKAPHHLVVVGQPSPASFNREVANAYAAAVAECGQTAQVRDLYRSGFDPVLKLEERPGPHYRLHPEIAAELELVRTADVVALVFPVWFGMPPAMITGYVDRVIGADFAMSRVKEDSPSALLEGKRLVLLTTSATTRPWLEEKGQWVSLHHAFASYLPDIFGLKPTMHLHLDAIVPDLPQQVVLEHLETVRQFCTRVCADEFEEARAERMRSLLAR